MSTPLVRSPLADHNTTVTMNTDPAVAVVPSDEAPITCQIFDFET